MKRGGPLKRYTALKKRRAKVRPGRLRGAQVSDLREKAWERDRGVCQRCLVAVGSEPWELSHRRGKRNWGDDLDNVQVEHRRCHQLFHAYGPSGVKPCPPKD